MNKTCFGASTKMNILDSCLSTAEEKVDHWLMQPFLLLIRSVVWVILAKQGLINDTSGDGVSVDNSSLVCFILGIDEKSGIKMFVKTRAYLAFIV